jgi:hypothetical protein
MFTRSKQSQGSRRKDMEQRMLLIIKRLSGTDLAIRARKNDQITYQTARWGRVPGQ